MLAQVYQFSHETPPLTMVIDPAEYAAHTGQSSVETLLELINRAGTAAEIHRIEQLLKPLAIQILLLQDIASTREHILSGGH